MSPGVNESVLGIYRPSDKAKYSEFDVILSNVLSRFNVNDCVFIIVDLNFDTNHTSPGQSLV